MHSHMVAGCRFLGGPYRFTLSGALSHHNWPSLTNAVYAYFDRTLYIHINDYICISLDEKIQISLHTIHNLTNAQMVSTSANNKDQQFKLRHDYAISYDIKCYTSSQRLATHAPCGAKETPKDLDQENRVPQLVWHPHMWQINKKKTGPMGQTLRFLDLHRCEHCTT